MIYGGGDGFKACIVQDGKLVELCTKLAWRNKSLRPRGMAIVQKTFTFLLLLIAPQPVLSPEEKEAAATTSGIGGVSGNDGGGDVNNEQSAFSTFEAKQRMKTASMKRELETHHRAAANRSVQVENKTNLSRWICILLRNLISLQKTQHLPELKRLLHIKDVIKGATGEKFKFQSERYEQRKQEEKIKMLAERLSDKQTNNGNNDDFSHLLPNEMIDEGSRKIKPNEFLKLKVCEADLIKAKIRFCDVLSLGASLLKLQCSSAACFHEFKRTERAMRGYDRMPEWNLENVKVSVFFFFFFLYSCFFILLLLFFFNSHFFEINQNCPSFFSISFYYVYPK